MTAKSLPSTGRVLATQPGERRADPQRTSSGAVSPAPGGTVLVGAPPTVMTKAVTVRIQVSNGRVAVSKK